MQNSSWLCALPSARASSSRFDDGAGAFSDGSVYTPALSGTDLLGMVRALDRQVDLLRNVRSRRNRLLISTNVFEVDPDALSQLEAAVSAADLKTYIELLDRYKKTQQLALPR